MLTAINPTETQAWAALNAHAQTAKQWHLSNLFADDPKRFDAFSARFSDEILLDYSKNLINQDTLGIVCPC